METVDAAVAGAQFEALLAKVEKEHVTVALTRDDLEVARLEPSSRDGAARSHQETNEYVPDLTDPMFDPEKNPLHFLYIGGGKITGDVESPVAELSSWKALR